MAVDRRRSDRDSRANRKWFPRRSRHRDGKLISGTATANPTAVIEAAADRKAQALADQKARDDALLRTLESQVRSGMQEYFNDPANDMGLPITVIELSLIKVADNKYEGMATMKAGTNHPRDVLVHVTEDDRNGMWNTDPGRCCPYSADAGQPAAVDRSGRRCSGPGLPDDAAGGPGAVHGDQSR